MIYWITSDTHFGHDKMRESLYRSNYFEDKIMKRHSSLVKSNDVLIHLGDFCFGKNEHWHREFMMGIKGVKWLLRGNHDKKSISWYLDHGWDFVGDSMTIKMYGKIILFSHRPMADTGFDLNIHGHLHNGDHRMEEFSEILTQKHKLVKMEHDYKPVSLKSLSGQ